MRSICRLTDTGSREIQLLIKNKMKQNESKDRQDIDIDEDIDEDKDEGEDENEDTQKIKKTLERD